MCVRVVNCRGLNKPDQRAGVVYVGRRFAGWPEHPLRNPYRPMLAPDAIQGAIIAACLDRYRAHLDRLPDLDEKLSALWEQCERGAKPLGCWCCEAVAGDGSPVVCHAQILAEMLRERFCGKETGVAN